MEDWVISRILLKQIISGTTRVTGCTIRCGRPCTAILLTVSQHRNKLTCSLNKRRAAIYLPSTKQKSMSSILTFYSTYQGFGGMCLFPKLPIHLTFYQQRWCQKQK